MTDPKYTPYLAYLRADQIRDLKLLAEQEDVRGVQVFIRRAIDLFLIDNSTSRTKRHAEKPEQVAA